MGKLHKIRRAFEKLSNTRKISIWNSASVCRIKPDGKVEFTYAHYVGYKKSYQNYVAKISEEWLVKHLASKHNDGVALRD